MLRGTKLDIDLNSFAWTRVKPNSGKRGYQLTIRRNGIKWITTRPNIHPHPAFQGRKAFKSDSSSTLKHEWHDRWDVYQRKLPFESVYPSGAQFSLLQKFIRIAEDEKKMESAALDFICENGLLGFSDSHLGEPLEPILKWAKHLSKLQKQNEAYFTKRKILEMQNQSLPQVRRKISNLNRKLAHRILEGASSLNPQSKLVLGLNGTHETLSGILERYEPKTFWDWLQFKMLKNLKDSFSKPTELHPEIIGICPACEKPLFKPQRGKNPTRHRGKCEKRVQRKRSRIRHQI